MKFSFTNILIFISSFLFSQQDYAFIYLDNQNSKKNKVIAKVESIMKKHNVIFYMSDESYNEVITNKEEIENQLDKFPTYWRGEDEYKQVIKINNFFNDYDIFESLKSNEPLSNDINFYFFFNHFDFFISTRKTQAKTIIDKILFSNNLFSFENEKKMLHKKCKIYLYLNYNIKDYYGRGTSEEEVRKNKKELEKILNNLYSNNYEYQII